MRRDAFEPSNEHDAYYEEPGAQRYANGKNRDVWGEPDLSLLGTGRRAAPAFPLDLLGPWADWAAARARTSSAPPDYVATSLLTCAGAALANVRWPLAGATWSEPPVLWCGNVGSPSSGKSPAMDTVFSLVSYAEDRMSADFPDVLADYTTRKLAAEARAEAWRTELKAAVMAGGDPPPMPADAKVPTKPERPRIRVADATTEKLAMLAANLPRGQVLVRDELSGFIGGLDRYSGGGSDRAFVIEMYGGRSYAVDRMKHDEPIQIRHLSVAVLGGIQPDKLTAILEGPDDGLAARLLWAWPETKPAFKINREIRDDTEARDAFAQITSLPMGSDTHGNPEPTILRLSREAEDALEAFGQETETRAEDAAGIYAGALGKARGHALRLACIIDHLWWAMEPFGTKPLETIEAPAMRAAVEMMTTYFLPMAERVFGDAAVPVSERRAMHLVKYLKRTRRSVFNARDVRREIGGTLREAAHMEEACEGLVEANLIRPVTSEAKGPGRRAKSYDVNPALYRGLA